MEKSRRSDVLQSNDSLGILDMDNLKVLGDDSMLKTTNLTEKLKEERLKAFKTLEKIDKARKSINKTLIKTPTDVRNITKTPGLEKTDYVRYSPWNLTNISDLIVDKTINLNTTTSPYKDPNKISFEPSEMTGRSTLYKHEVSRKNKPISLEQILATSCSEKVRNFRDSIRDSGTSSSCPKTADLSKCSPDTTSESNPGLSFHDCHCADESDFAGENFIPAENMKSKLAADERDWEQEFAAIPPPEKKPQNGEHANGGKSGVNSSAYILDPNLSIGHYFRMRSENLNDMISKSGSPTKHVPVALVDESSLTSTEITRYVSSETRNTINVPQVIINDKTFCKSASPQSLKDRSAEEPSQNKLESNDNSYILSLSAIADALNKIETDDSGTAVVNKLLSKKMRNCVNAPKPFDKANEVEQSQSRIESANKENVNPHINVMLSDTASFSESILNCSEMKKFEEKNKTWQNSKYTLKISGENQTFQQSTNSSNHHPETKSPLKTIMGPEMNIQETFALKLNNKKDKNAEKPPPANKEHHLNKTSASASKSPSSAHTESRKRPYSTINRSLSPNLSDMKGPRRSRSLSPVNESNRNISPASSQRSISTNLSPGCSDRNYNFPTLDNSCDSERRFVVDSLSPDCGKFSLPSYGLVSRANSNSNLGVKPSVTRCISQCSTSSEFSHRDGVMPLKATCLELSWGSIKLRKSVNKSLQIKNSSTKRLVVRIEVTGPGFQIVSSVGSNLLTLQSQECRTIILSFCPTVIGAAIGQLSFKPPGREIPSQGLNIFLYGFGGHANLATHGTFQGPVGSAFLTMGELRQLSGPLVKTFSVQNTGALKGFAVVLVDSIGLDLPRLHDCIEVTPAKVLVPPEGSVTFRVTFKPRREDIKKIIKKISNVMTLANLRVITGDEPTRQRIRNLIRKMKDSEKSKISSASLDKVWNSFPNEHHIYELDTLKEQSEVAMELVSTLRTHEIALTLNHSALDETTENTLVFSDADETIMFRTIIANPALPSNKSRKDNLTESELDKKETGEKWSVRPNVLEIDPFSRGNSVLTVRSFFPNTQYFEIVCNFKHLFHFTPSGGEIPPGGSTEISVSYFQPSFLPSEQINIMIYIENGKITVPVKIAMQNNLSQFR